MISQELYQEILNSCGLSQVMKEHLEKQDLSKHDLIKLLVNAPVALTKKRDLLEYIAETEDLYEEMLELVNSLLPGERGQLREWQSVWACSATRIKGELQKAIDALQVGEGEFFWMEEHWFDYEWLDENQGGVCAFQSLDAALQAIRDMMQEEKWDENTECWSELTKWTPGENGVMVNEYRYYLIRDEIVYFSKKIDGPGAYGYLDPYCFMFPTEEIYFSTPFQPGDIVTLDVRPFAPPLYAVLLETGCGSGLRGLYFGLDDRWHVTSIIDLDRVSDGPQYRPILSPIYRMDLCRPDALFEYEKTILEEIHELVKRDKARGGLIDSAFFPCKSLKGDEVLSLVDNILLKEGEW